MKSSVECSRAHVCRLVFVISAVLKIRRLSIELFSVILSMIEALKRVLFLQQEIFRSNFVKLLTTNSVEKTLVFIIFLKLNTICQNISDHFDTCDM
jgi:hypothetical protein